MNLRNPLSLATAPAILLASLLTACLQETTEQAQGPGGKGPTGQANLSLKLEKVGALRKAAAIEMDTLFIGLTATGEAPVLDTVLLSGNSLQAILKSYPGLASLKTWTLGAIAKDQNGVTVYSGTTEFIVPPNGTANVPLTLAPQFSMLRALFFPIRDSVTQVQVRVDGSLVAAESFAKQSRLGDTVALTHDYLSASPSGTTHAIRMDVRGDMWGFDTVLYRGNTDITVVSGQDTSYSLTLHWVGPAVPPPGQATITVTLGAVGSVTLEGMLEDTIPVPVNYAWQTVGNSGFSAGGAQDITMLLDAAGNPVVGYRDVGYWHQPTVMRWDGSSWASIGSPGFYPSSSSYNTMALTGSGNPVVAFVDEATGNKPIVMRWNPHVALWENFGSTQPTQAYVDFLSLKIDPSGQPLVAFTDGAHGNRVTVMRWHLSVGDWLPVGTPGFSHNSPSHPVLALDANGNPVVAYAAPDGAVVMRWNGSAWQPVGTPVSMGGGMGQIALALDVNGNPVIAFRDWPNGSKAAVMRWNGSQWLHVGSPSASEGAADNFSLILDAVGNPVLAFRDMENESKATVIHWNGASWQTVGGGSLSTEQAYFLSLQLDTDGNPVVAFQDNANFSKVTVMRYAPMP